MYVNLLNFIVLICTTVDLCTAGIEYGSTYQRTILGILHNTTAVTLTLDIDSLIKCFDDAALTNVTIYEHSYDGLPLVTFNNSSDSDAIEQCLELQNASYHVTYSISPELSYIVGDEVTTGQITWNSMINEFAYPDSLSLQKRRTGQYAYGVSYDRNCPTTSNDRQGTLNLGGCYTLATNAYKSGFVQNLNNFGICYFLAYHHDCRDQSYRNLKKQQTSVCWNTNIYAVTAK